MNIKDLITMLQALGGERELTLNLSLSPQEVGNTPQPVEPAKDSGEKENLNKKAKLAAQLNSLTEQRKQAWNRLEEFLDMVDNCGPYDPVMVYWVERQRLEEELISEIDDKTDKLWHQLKGDGIIEDVERYIKFNGLEED